MDLSGAGLEDYFPRTSPVKIRHERTQQCRDFWKSSDRWHVVSCGATASMWSDNSIIITADRLSQLRKSAGADQSQR